MQWPWVSGWTYRVFWAFTPSIFFKLFDLKLAYFLAIASVWLKLVFKITALISFGFYNTFKIQVQKFRAYAQCLNFGKIKNGISYDSWKSWKVINKDFRGCYRYYVLFNGRGVFLSDKGSCFSAAAGNIIELEKQPMHFKSKQSLKIFSPKLAIWAFQAVTASHLYQLLLLNKDSRGEALNKWIIILHMTFFAFCCFFGHQPLGMTQVEIKILWTHSC